MEPKKNLPKLKMQPLPLREESPRSRPDPPVRRTGYARRTSYRPRYGRSLSGVRRPAGTMGSFALQCLACGMVFLMVLALQQLDLPVGNGLLDGLAFVVSENTELPQGSAQGWLEEALTVFSPGASSTACAPAPGEGVKTQEGWTLYRQPGEIRAVMDGTVFYIGEREQGTPYVRLRHSGGFESWYDGAALSVTVGQTLHEGDVLGQLAEGESLYFCLRQDGVIVDHTCLTEG